MAPFGFLQSARRVGSSGVRLARCYLPEIQTTETQMSKHLDASVKTGRRMHLAQVLTGGPLIRRVAEGNPVIMLIDELYHSVIHCCR